MLLLDCLAVDFFFLIGPSDETPLRPRNYHYSLKTPISRPHFERSICSRKHRIDALQIVGGERHYAIL